MILMDKNIADLTLNQLSEMADKIVISKNTTKIQKKVDNKVLTVQIKSYPTGESITATRHDISDNKTVQETIKEKLNNGARQSDVALELGVSQSYVSKVKNNKL